MDYPGTSTTETCSQDDRSTTTRPMDDISITTGLDDRSNTTRPMDDKSRPMIKKPGHVTISHSFSTSHLPREEFLRPMSVVPPEPEYTQLPTRPSSAFAPVNPVPSPGFYGFNYSPTMFPGFYPGHQFDPLYGYQPYPGLQIPSPLFHNPMARLNMVQVRILK